MRSQSKAKPMQHFAKKTIEFKLLCKKTMFANLILGDGVRLKGFYYLPCVWKNTPLNNRKARHGVEYEIHKQ